MGDAGEIGGPLLLAESAEVLGQGFHAAGERLESFVSGRRLRRDVRSLQGFERGAGLERRLEPQVVRQRKQEADHALDFAGGQLLLGRGQEEAHLLLPRQAAEVIGRGGAELADLDKGPDIR